MGRAGQRAFGGTNVGDPGAAANVGGDLRDQLDDAIDRSGEYDQIRLAHGGFGRGGDAGTPRLALQGDAHLGAARPDGDALGDSAGVGGEADGAAQQAGSEDREMRNHGERSGFEACCAGA